MLEDIIDRSDGAAGLLCKITGPQRRQPPSGDGAFGGIDQLLTQRRVPVDMPYDHPLNSVHNFA